MNMAVAMAMVMNTDMGHHGMTVPSTAVCRQIGSVCSEPVMLSTRTRYHRM